MNENDLEQFSESISLMCEIYEKKISPIIISMYFGSLAEFSIIDVELGFKNHLQDPIAGMFFPKPADIIRQIQKTNPAPVTDQEKAILAWANVMNVLENYGGFDDFDDKKIGKSINSIGGWKHLNIMSYDDLVWAKKSFLQNYESYVKLDDNLQITSSHNKLIDQSQ